MKSPGISLRLFFVILVVMVVLSWQFVVRASQHIETGIRQAVETTLVDMAQILATDLEVSAQRDGQLSVESFTRQYAKVLAKPLDAQIYDHHKTRMDVSVTVTDDKGIVHYDSSGRFTGADFSQWHDVYATLQGRYGARSSYIYENQNAPGDPREMVVAAPVVLDGQIIGVVSVAQPTSAYDFFNVNAAIALRWFVLGYLGLALAVLLLLAWWLARALRRISEYAEAMAAGKAAVQPRFYDHYLRRLAGAVRNLRQELNGKAEVESYVHSLTHELKTPMTSIQAAAEFLEEPDLSAAERARFCTQIQRANARMRALIERLLNLARLENRDTLESPQRIPLEEVLNGVIRDFSPLLSEKNLRIHCDKHSSPVIVGDRLLITQAIQNVLANALDFAWSGSRVVVSLKVREEKAVIGVYNAGELIPEYALPRVTERFFSLPRPDGKPRSSGLGLSFVAQIMSLHRGRLQISNVSDGVWVGLFFPLKREGE